jgi:hypothetical protein
LAPRGPGPLHGGDAFVHQAAAPVVVDARPRVLDGMAAHTDAQDEPSSGELLERCGLFGHGGRLA